MNKKDYKSILSLRNTTLNQERDSIYLPHDNDSKHRGRERGREGAKRIKKVA